MLVRKFLAKNKTVIMSQLPFLVPADFFLFPKLKTPIKGNRFATFWGDKRKIETGAVGDTKKSVSEGFRGLEKRWYKCVITEESYFEQQQDSYW